MPVTPFSASDPLPDVQPKFCSTFNRGLASGFGIGLITAAVACAAVWVIAYRSASSSSSLPWTGTVGFTPLLPTMCDTLGTSSAPIVIQVLVDGKPYAVVPDTGSSNFNLASTRCGDKCSVSPQWPGPGPGPTYEVSYGTGGAVMTAASARLSLAGVELTTGTFGAIVDQLAGTDQFNLFPAASDPVCHNTYAGILGFAYRAQDAGPLDNSGQTNDTTNGTTMPLLDQLVQGAGAPNAFAFEICSRYPQHCGPRTDNTTWAPSRTCDVNYNIGNFYLGGYRSTSLSSEMQYTPISDEIHYNVVLLGITVCGSKGCTNVTFPDEIGGATEDSCRCKTPDCAMPLDKDEYCYFTVVDSGADGIYMNTVGNTKALLNAMNAVAMVDLPPGANSTAFYFDRLPVLGATVNKNAQFGFHFPDMHGKPFQVHVQRNAIFRYTMAGLVQMAVQSDLAAAAAFQAAKFPVLLGSTIMADKVTYFDRSRKRLGFAWVWPEKCGTPVSTESEIDVRGLVTDTPGVGCRKGTGSGGGCKQAMRPQTVKFAAERKLV